jgi:signal transduction histidine kinase
LTGILGLSSILAEDYETITRDGLLDIAQDIHRSAQRLQRLIENFLIYAQLQLLNESDQRLPFGNNTLPIPAETIVGRAARQQAEAVGRADDLRCDFQPCALPILGENLNKIVEELVSNALKFSDAGTPVRVATEQAQGVFTLTVTDQGRGMTREQIARIGPHMQFDSRTYEQQGSGLGLVIARRLTELQGGEWSIDSTLGRFTTVRVSFPCSAPTTLSPEVSTPASPALAG